MPRWLLRLTGGVVIFVTPFDTRLEAGGSNSFRLPIRLVPERDQNSQIGFNQPRSSCHARPDRSHPSLIILRPCRYRRPDKVRDRLGAFAPLAGLRLHLE